MNVPSKGRGGGGSLWRARQCLRRDDGSEDEGGMIRATGHEEKEEGEQKQQ